MWIKQLISVNFKPGFNSGIELELKLIPNIIPGIGLGITFLKNCNWIGVIKK